jgi:hypothetical protein
MTIAAAIIAGLFFFFTGDPSNNIYLTLLARLSGLGLALFILSAAIYLTLLLSQEGVEARDRIQFLKDSKKDFLEKVGVEITDMDSYEVYRQKKYEEEGKLERKIVGSHEIWFIFVLGLFVISSMPLVIMFLKASL